MNPLSYYEEIAKSQYPNLTPAEQKAKAQEAYKQDPQSDYTGSRTKTTTSGSQLNPIPSGPRTDWESFTNGKVIYNAAKTDAAGVTTEAFITLPQTNTKQPQVKRALLPSADGVGFELIDLNTAAANFRALIPNTDADYKYYKTQLSAYYPSKKDFQNSLTQPIRENDLGFEEAIKKAINTVSLDNFNKAQRFAKGESSVPQLQGYDVFVKTRNLLPGTSSQRQSTSSLTTEMDANAEFNRTVQQFIGNPDLVDKVDVLRKVYWDKLHKEELRRVSISKSTTDPLGLNTNITGISYAPLTEQDRIEMRLGLIIKGDKKSDSVGIKNATQEQLEDEGALVGAAYGKLKEVAADYGIQLTHSDLLGRVYTSLKPGGVTAGVSPSSMATGLEQEANSIKQAAKVHFKGLEKYIDQGLKVSDISSNFQRLKEQEMGLTDNAVDIYDADVQKAIGGADVSSVNDFILGVRSNPAWRKTPKANEMAATFINTILKSWGKVG